MKNTFFPILIFLFPFSINSNNNLGNIPQSNSHVGLFVVATALAGSTIAGCSYVHKRIGPFYERSTKRMVTTPSFINRAWHRLLNIIDPQAPLTYARQKFQSNSHWFSSNQKIPQPFTVDEFLTHVPSEQTALVEQAMYNSLLDPRQDPLTRDTNSINDFVTYVHDKQPNFNPNQSHFRAACALPNSQTVAQLLKRNSDLQVDDEAIRIACGSGVPATLDCFRQHDNRTIFTDNHCLEACRKGNQPIIKRVFSLSRLQPQRKHLEAVSGHEKEGMIRTLVKLNPKLARYGRCLLVANFLRHCNMPAYCQSTVRLSLCALDKTSYVPDFEPYSLFSSGNLSTLKALHTLIPNFCPPNSEMFNAACLANSGPIVRYLVSQTPGLSGTNKDLSIACNHGNHEIVDSILSQRQTFSPIKTEDLLKACRSGSTATVERLLTYDQNLMPDKNHLRLAYQFGDTGMVDLLLERNPELKPNGNCLLVACESAFRSSLLVHVFEHNPDLVPKTPQLDKACESGNTRSVELVLDHNPNLMPDKKHLELACEHGTKKMVRLLLKRNPELKVSKRHVSLACSFGTPKMVEALIKHSEGTILVDNQLISAACRQGNYETLAFLLDYNPSINANSTHLTDACSAESTASLYLLLKSNSELVPTQQAFDLASKQNKPKLTELILKRKHFDQVPAPQVNPPPSLPFPIYSGQEKPITSLIDRLLTTEPCDLPTLLDECYILALLYQGRSDEIEILADAYNYIVSRHSWYNSKIPSEIAHLIRQFANSPY